jgi:XRE family transcriptional regulator, regulator of sulfur utilization
MKESETVHELLGARLREIRKGQGLSLPALAKLSGVSKGNLSRIEHGGNVTVATLYRLCWSLGVHPSEALPPDWPNT